MKTFYSSVLNSNEVIVAVNISTLTVPLMSQEQGKEKREGCWKVFLVCFVLHCVIYKVRYSRFSDDVVCRHYPYSHLIELLISGVLISCTLIEPN